jgi:hypothetical protein
VRAPREVLYKLRFFVKLFHGGVCGAEFVKQCQTPSNMVLYVAETTVVEKTKTVEAKAAIR